MPLPPNFPDNLAGCPRLSPIFLVLFLAVVSIHALAIIIVALE